MTTALILLPLFGAVLVWVTPVPRGVLAPFAFLAALTEVVAAAAIGYACWAGRERPRAYFGLLLFLLGATVGVFTAQDLLVFYVFFEAMLIPLYVLVGVWGGPRPA